MSSLQDRLDGISGLVDCFYNGTLAPHAKHRADLVTILGGMVGIGSFENDVRA